MIIFVRWPGNYFGFSAKTLHQGCQKDILRVLGNVLTNSLGKKNMYLFTIFQTLSRKMSETRQRIQQVYQTEFNGSKRNFWGFFVKKAFTSSVSHFDRKTDRVVKNVIWMSKKTFWGQTIFGKNIFFLIIFGLRITFLSELWRKYFSTVVLTAFYVSRGRVWVETFF